MLVITMGWGCIHDTSKASTCSQEHQLRTLENVLPCPYHMDWPLSCSWACDGVCAILCALYRWLRQALLLSRACFSFSLGMTWQFWCWKKCYQRYQCCVLYSCINLGPQLPLRHDMRNMWAHVSLQNSDPDNMAADRGTRSQQKAAEPPSAKWCKLRIYHGDEPLTLVILGHPGTIAQPSMKALFQWLVGSFNLYPWRIPENSLEKHGKGSHRWPLKTAWDLRDALRRSTTMPPGCTLARWAVLSMSSLGSLFRFWAELRGWNWCWLRIDWAILRGYFSCHFLWTANIHSTSELPQWPTKLHFTWDRQILNTGGFNPVEQYHYNISQFQAWVQIEAKNGKHQNVIVEKDQYNTIHHTSPYSIRSHQQQSDKLANVDNFDMSYPKSLSTSQHVSTWRHAAQLRAGNWRWWNQPLRRPPASADPGDDSIQPSQVKSRLKSMSLL